MNKMTLLGRLGQTPDLRHLPNGNSTCTISVATTEKWKNSAGQAQSHTEWHRVVFWGKLAEIVAKHLDKGSQVLITGKLRTREWEDKDGIKRYTTEIQADYLEMLGGGKKDENSRQTSSQSQNSEHQNDSGSDYSINDDASFASDDIPF